MFSAIAVAALLVAMEPQPTAPAPQVAEKEVAPAARPIRIAVYDFDVTGLEPRVGRVVTDAVVAEVRKLDGVVVLSMTEVRAMLGHEAEKQLLGCEDDSCLAEIAEALGADTIVIGQIARLEEEEVFGMRRIEQRKAETKGVVNQRLKVANGDELLAVIGPSVAGLFPEHGLREGMRRGVSEQAAMRLNPPPLPPWMFFTGVGTTAALAVGAGAVTATWIALDIPFQQFRDTKSYTQAEFEARAAPVATANVATWVSWGVVATSAVTTAALAGFTDFWGYGESTFVEVQ